MVYIFAGSARSVSNTALHAVGASVRHISAGFGTLRAAGAFPVNYLWLLIINNLTFNAHGHDESDIVAVCVCTLIDCCGF